MLKVKSIRPVYTRLITTANRYTESQKVGSILDANKLEGRYKEYQTVVKVGSSVREVKEGDVVLIDPSRYMKRKYNDNSLREDFVENPIVEINIPISQDLSTFPNLAIMYAIIPALKTKLIKIL